jgi:hypothetical protein
MGIKQSRFLDPLTRHKIKCQSNKVAYNKCFSANRIIQRNINSTIRNRRAEENELNYKRRTITAMRQQIEKYKIKIRKLRDSYNSLKSVCMSADATNKKNKVEQLKMLTGRYLDRINLLESQKNVLNKQSLLFTSKIDKNHKNKQTFDKLNKQVANKSRMGLYSMEIDNKNTRIIWFLKISSYIMSIVLLFLIMKKL